MGAYGSAEDTLTQDDFLRCYSGLLSPCSSWENSFLRFFPDVSMRNKVSRNVARLVSWTSLQYILEQMGSHFGSKCHKIDLQIPICSNSHLFAKSLQAFLKLQFSKNNFLQKFTFWQIFKNDNYEITNWLPSTRTHFRLAPTSYLPSANSKCVFLKEYIFEKVHYYFDNYINIEFGLW